MPVTHRPRLLPALFAGLESAAQRRQPLGGTAAAPNGVSVPSPWNGMAAYGRADAADAARSCAQFAFSLNTAGVAVPYSASVSA